MIFTFNGIEKISQVIEMNMIVSNEKKREKSTKKNYKTFGRSVPIFHGLKEARKQTHRHRNGKKG